MKSGYFNIAGGAIRTAFSLATIPLLIRIIGIEEYGLWALISAVIGVVTLAEVGLSVATTTFVSRDLGKEDISGIGQTITVTTVSMLVLATVAALVTWFGAEVIAGFFKKLSEFQHDTAVKALRISALVIWVRLLQQNFVGVEQAYQRYGLMNAILTIQSILANAGMIIVAWSHGGRIVAIMKWQLIVSVLALIVHGSVVRMLVKPSRIRFQWNKGKSRKIFQFSMLTWVSSLGSVLFAQCDRLIVGAFADSNILGVYAAITNVTAQINTLSALPVQPLLPTISKDWGEGKGGDFRPLIRHALQMNALAALGLGAVLISFTPTITQMILQSRDSNYAWCFQIATVIYAIYSMNAVGYHALFGMGALKDCAAIQLASGALSLLLIGVGVAAFGLKGAIVGNVGYWCVWLLTARAMQRMKIPFRFWGRVLSFYLVWFLAVWGIDFILPQGILLKTIVLLIELTVLCLWFFRETKSSFIIRDESHC